MNIAAITSGEVAAITDNTPATNNVNTDRIRISTMFLSLIAKKTMPKKRNIRSRIASIVTL
jgi:hypothetical protein